MPDIIHLSPEDREFWELVSRAAFANPFSQERASIDHKIVELTGGSESRDRIQVLTEAVRQRLAGLEKTGKANLKLYSGEDRYVIQSVFLFDLYHQFYDRLDQVILNQIELGDAPGKVGFADEALDLLTRRGFSRDDALRFFAILYQIRRAHYFIAKGLIGRSSCMEEFRRRLWNNIFTHDIRWYDRYLWNRMEDFSTLFLGETGTGKGTAAAAIGRSGFIPFDERKNRFTESFTRSFVSLNLAEHPEALIESELFGHRKGAFTGAIEAHQGIFARCSPHGAIFLDEIGDVGIPVQIKLLHVLQERTFSPVGSHEKLRFRGRVIAATNKPLDALRDAGLFRDDFFYRLCSDIIQVPPLRQRLREEPGELDELLHHVLARLTGERALELAGAVREALWERVGRDYAWPGNVRELEQAVRQILLTRQYVGDQRTAGADARRSLMAGIDAGTLDADGVLSAYCALLYQQHRSFEEVARRMNLDWRTVKKYLQQQAPAAR